VSVRADTNRQARKFWARRGSGHDRIIAVLRIALPAAIGALGAAMVFTPLVNRDEFSFVLDKNKVAIARDRFAVTSALYRGEDDRGRPFVLSAGSAVQKSVRDPVVKIADMTARIALEGGPAQLIAESAQYDMDADTVAVDGPISVAGNSGFGLRTRDVLVDLKAHTMTGSNGVSGTLPIGRFSANSLFADLDARVVRLSGAARLHINQGAIR
jgi:lipopolysaccharide export system protein LptC